MKICSNGGLDETKLDAVFAQYKNRVPDVDSFNSLPENMQSFYKDNLSRLFGANTNYAGGGFTALVDENLMGASEFVIDTSVNKMPTAKGIINSDFNLYIYRLNKTGRFTLVQ